MLTRNTSAVNEGYATQRTIPSATPTPYPSPIKSSTASTSASQPQASLNTHIPIFRSANDTLAEVFSSPERVSGGNALHTPSPSPKKRGRAASEAASDESDDEEELDEPVLESPTKLRMGASSANTPDMILDSDVVGGASPSPTRPIRPLRKSAPSQQSA